MDDDQEMENFESSEWFDGRRKRTQTKDDALYGIFAGESSDSDYEGSKKKKRKNRDLIGKADLTKPVQFVSIGVPSQVIDEKPKEQNQLDDEYADRMPSGLGFGAVRTDLEEGGSSKNENDEFLPSGFGKRIKEGAELRRVKEKEKSMQARKSSQVGRKDPESGAKHYTNSIGMKLMEKMGYTRGAGLGKHAQGIVAPIEAELRPKKEGLGFNTKPTLKKKQEEIPVALVLQQPAEGPSKEKLWSKKAQLKKAYITADELLQKKQEQNLERVQKVFDMRGPQVRVLTNLENLNAEAVARENDVPMPELQHNVKLIMDLVEVDIQKIGRDLSNERETFASLQREKDKIQSDLSKQEIQLNNMRKIASMMKHIEEESSLGTLTLESLALSFSDMHTNFGNDYKLCNLSSIACAYALPLFIRVFQGWNPLQNPRHGQDIVSQWKSLLHEDSMDMFVSTSPYTQLIMEVVFPAVRISGTNTWQARDPEPMLNFIDSWERLLTPGVVQIILDSIIMPKLSAAVNSWDPRQEKIPIHSWVHPWLPLLGNKLEPFYQTIRDRLESVLHAWHPSDMSAYYILAPWKTVFDAASWDKLMVRYIVPKLLTVMQEFQINPANQTLDQFYWVRTWATTIPIQHMIVVLEVFFTKWFGVLHHWLNSNPNFEEVGKWYLGWKELLPDELLANEHIRSRLHGGLAMMNQAVEGMKVVQPGLGEKLSYQKKVEERQFEKAAAQARERGRVGADNGASVHGSAGFEMSLKEVIEVYAQQNGLLFKPKPGRMQDGHQIYGFGSINIIIDTLNQKVFALMDDRWILASLEQLLDLHKRAVSKRS